MYLLARYIFHLANALHHQDLCYHKIYCARDTFDTLGVFFAEKGTALSYIKTSTENFMPVMVAFPSLVEPISQLPSKLVKSYRSSSTP